MSSDDRQLIELQAEPADQGEIRYARARTVVFRPKGFMAGAAGLAIGASIFFFLGFFFMFIILPAALAFFLWMRIRHWAVQKR